MGAVHGGGGALANHFLGDRIVNNLEHLINQAQQLQLFREHNYCHCIQLLIIISFSQNLDHHDSLSCTHFLAHGVMIFCFRRTRIGVFTPGGCSALTSTFSLHSRGFLPRRVLATPARPPMGAFLLDVFSLFVHYFFCSHSM